VTRIHALATTLFRSALVAALGALLLAAVPRGAQAQTTDALLDTLQHSGVMYFWNEANPANGLVRDRSSISSPASIAATGFGLSALCVGVDHGWLSRAQVQGRVLNTLNTFWTVPQGSQATGTIGFHGLFYHFLDMTTGMRTWTSELSTIDTALLMAGILDVRQYFSTNDTGDVHIRALADSIDRRLDWTFMRNLSSGIEMGWNPEHKFADFGRWRGYNEAMIMYLEALGSPTHAVPATDWQYWTSGYSWQTWYGQDFLVCPPLFTHQYTQCWVDLRATQDSYMANPLHNSTYYINSQRATIANRAYCIANPGGFLAYGDSLWGLTASDDPFGYNAHGAPPAQTDNGTITPTAAISSISFTPDLALPVIRNLWNSWRGQLWGPYGYVDAFNPTNAWTDTDVLGIDQGPIVLSIENYRTGAVWGRIANDPEIAAGMAAAGFVPHSTGVPPIAAGVGLAIAVDPNPAAGRAAVACSLPSASRLRVDLYDVRGRRVAAVLDADRPAGVARVALPTTSLAPGVYLVRVMTDTAERSARFVKLR